MPVGNPAPDFYREVRPGTDLYADSVGALDVKTGKLLWYDKFVAIDMHDWDLSQVSPIFRAPAKGKERNLLTVTGKDGFLRMIDRDSRELLYEMPITTRENADAEPTVSGVHICPDSSAGWSGAAPPWIPKAIPCSWSRSTGAESSRDTGGSVGGGVISYELDGKQYVATTSGVISGFSGGSGTSAVLIFACIVGNERAGEALFWPAHEPGSTFVAGDAAASSQEAVDRPVSRTRPFDRGGIVGHLIAAELEGREPPRTLRHFNRGAGR